MSSQVTIFLLPFRWMFWTDWGEIQKIERAGMDGSQRKVILKDHVHWPNGLSVDLLKNLLFWVDAKLGTLSCSSLDGSYPKIIVQSKRFLKHPFSLSVFEDFVYWSDWGTMAIYKAAKFSGKNITRVTSTSLVRQN